MSWRVACTRDVEKAPNTALVFGEKRCCRVSDGPASVVCPARTQEKPGVYVPPYLRIRRQILTTAEAGRSRQMQSIPVKQTLGRELRETGGINKGRRGGGEIGDFCEIMRQDEVKVKATGRCGRAASPAGAKQEQWSMAGKSQNGGLWLVKGDWRSRSPNTV